ncbi:UDP-N-acetylmuramoyl-tripeptide--D-alanyl-D-alanine ligase [bacterium]|nr:MAG: UDP-N-acetylmuramoyl-tripeptide--D-alanyl-D-alanine ligase [bacterium]
MIQETLQWAADAMGGSFHGSHPEAEFRGVCTDTRALKPGEVFFCLVGERDGHNFAAQAVDAGAACVVADEFHRASLESLPARAQAVLVKDTLRALGDLARAWRRRFAVPIVAVAGSNGKTTTKELTKAVLETRIKILATEGNFNNLIGVPKTLFRLEAGHRAAVVETGMNDFGELARLTEIVEPTAGLVTNIGLEHLEKLGDLDGVQRAEGELFAGLAPEAVALVNRLDERVCALPTRARKIYYGKPGDPVWGEVLEGAADAERPLRLKVSVDGETAELALRLPGPHHLSNVLAALAEAAPEGDPARQGHELGEQVLLHRLLGGGEAHDRILERELVPNVDEVEEGDRLQEVGLVVGQEHDVAARQAVEHVVALHVDVVQDREVGDREADAEAREQPAPQPATEEGAGDDGLGERGTAGRRRPGRMGVSGSGSGQESS